jgi:hypothetical protein
MLGTAAGVFLLWLFAYLVPMPREQLLLLVGIFLVVVVIGERA